MYCGDVDVVSGSILMEELTTVSYKKVIRQRKKKCLKYSYLVLWNRNDLLRFPFRFLLWQSFGSSSGFRNV